MFNDKTDCLPKEVSKGAKIRNRYNQVPHLTQDTNGKQTVKLWKQMLKASFQTCKISNE